MMSRRRRDDQKLPTRPFWRRSSRWRDTCALITGTKPLIDHINVPVVKIYGF